METVMAMAIPTGMARRNKTLVASLGTEFFRAFFMPESGSMCVPVLQKDPVFEGRPHAGTLPRGFQCTVRP